MSFFLSFGLRKNFVTKEGLLLLPVFSKGNLIVGKKREEAFFQPLLNRFLVLTASFFAPSVIKGKRQKSTIAELL